MLLLLLLLLPSHTASGIASSTNDSPTTDAEDVDKAEEDKAELLPFPSSLIPLYRGNPRRELSSEPAPRDVENAERSRKRKARISFKGNVRLLTSSRRMSTNY